MLNGIFILAITAITVGFIHTLVGPDHYLPFVVLAKARQWSAVKTFTITFLCGIGHVLSSVVLGFAGVILGMTLFKIGNIESSRGDLAEWFLMSFGFAYFIWGIHRAIRNRPHRHMHIHEEGREHAHFHAHSDEHVHPHAEDVKSLTPWVLFIIFVFGPCEPLIPLIMYPAARHNMLAVAVVALVFGFATITTMMGIVMASFYGLSKLRLHIFERYSHAAAGFAIFACGAAIKLFGL